MLRAGKKLALPLKLAAAPETPPREAIRIKSRSPFQGAEVMNLSPAVIGGAFAADRRGRDAARASSSPTSRRIRSPANFGVQKGDVVVEVNGAAIETTHDLEQAPAQRARYWDLTISRGGQLIRSRIGG